MKALVIYDSVFGNTEKIALAVGEGAGAQVVKVDALQDGALAGVELLLVGSPTRGFRPTEGIQKFLKGLPKGSLAGVAVGGFDTRMDVDEVNNKVADLHGQGSSGMPRNPSRRRWSNAAAGRRCPPAGFFMHGIGRSAPGWGIGTGEGMGEAGSREGWLGQLFRHPEQGHHRVPVAGGDLLIKFSFKEGVVQFRAPVPLGAEEVDLLQPGLHFIRDPGGGGQACPGFGGERGGEEGDVQEGGILAARGQKRVLPRHARHLRGGAQENRGGEAEFLRYGIPDHFSENRAVSLGAGKDRVAGLDIGAHRLQAEISEQGLKFGHGHAFLPADVDALEKKDPFGHGCVVNS